MKFKDFHMLKSVYAKLLIKGNTIEKTMIFLHRGSNVQKPNITKSSATDSIAASTYYGRDQYRNVRIYNMCAYIITRLQEVKRDRNRINWLGTNTKYTWGEILY